MSNRVHLGSRTRIHTRNPPITGPIIWEVWYQLLRPQLLHMCEILKELIKIFHQNYFKVKGHGPFTLLAILARILSSPISPFSTLLNEPSGLTRLILEIKAFRLSLGYLLRPNLR